MDNLWIIYGGKIWENVGTSAKSGGMELPFFKNTESRRVEAGWSWSWYDHDIICSQWHTELEKHCRLADLLFTVLAGYGSSAWSNMVYMDIHGICILYSWLPKWRGLKMRYCMVLPTPKGSSSASPRMLLFYGYPPSWDTPKYIMVGIIYIYIHTYTHTLTHVYDKYH